MSPGICADGTKERTCESRDETPGKHQERKQTVGTELLDDQGAKDMSFTNGAGVDSWG